MPKQIKTVARLKHLSGSIPGGLECFVVLNFNCKSSKHISFDGDYFYIENYIDGSSDSFTEKQLLKSIIGKALKKGALYAD